MFDHSGQQIVILTTAKLQWLKDPSEINDDNQNNVRYEARRHFRNNKRAYLKDKINKLAEQKHPRPVQRNK
jgi:hypothetical protein